MEKRPFMKMEDFYTIENESFSDSLTFEAQNPEILILSLDLGDGRRKKLVLHENDNPDLLAIEFCQQNFLGPRAKLAICEEIDKHLFPNYTKEETDSQYKNLLRSTSLKTQKKRNIGHELYIKGVKMKEKTKIHSKKIIESRIAEEMKNFTFSPETNSPIRRTKPPEDILLEKGKEKNEKLHIKRSAKELQLLSNCTFSPEINKNSAKMIKNERSPNRHIFLYHDANFIREKILEKANNM